MPTLQPSQLIEHLTDAFDSRSDRLVHGKAATLAECVPLLAIALEYHRPRPGRAHHRCGGEAIARARCSILENLRPVIERQAEHDVRRMDAPGRRRRRRELRARGLISRT